MTIDDKLDCVYIAKKIAPYVKFEDGPYWHEGIFCFFELMDEILSYITGSNYIKRLYTRSQWREFAAAESAKSDRRKARMQKKYSDLGLTEEQFDAYDFTQIMRGYIPIQFIKDENSFENCLYHAIAYAKDSIDEELSYDYPGTERKIKVKKEKILELCCAEVFARNKPIQFLDYLRIYEGYEVKRFIKYNHQGEEINAWKTWEESRVKKIN